VEHLYYKHIGVYAFRKEALVKFANLEMTPLEISEKIEAIRYLENGMKIKMIETDFIGVGIDVPEDLEKAREILNSKIGEL
jgi:3-deoxy-manno-octulosonate cytidylyltransferase (CMP-KDO synthetase)